MTKRMMWVVVGSLMLGSQPVWAARTQVHEAAESQEYGRKFGGMIGRGLLNGVTCFVDILVNIVNETKAGPPLVGTLTGLAKGTGCGVLRLGSGIVDLGTFWVPGFNGFPVSDSYDNCLAGTGGSASAEEVSGTGQSAATWSVPTAEPGAAQAPVEPAPARSWKK